MNDEAVWDLLVTLYAMIDAYEEHYAEQLERLRAQRYRELHDQDKYDDQLSLPLHDWEDQLF